MEVKIQKDDEGSFVVIPKEIMDELGWNEFTIIEPKFDEESKSIKVSQKTEWTVEEITFEDTFDMVMNDVVNNKIVHFINYEGKKYVLAPYIEDEFND
jgi:bifunctional DNA-binding transcriptional regulator/antitoxin component of YhaV-PrlF toxin-antitoxin module